MSSLLEIQQDLQNFLLDKSLNILDHIKFANDAEAVSRLEIYSNGYYSRLQETLEENFPKLKLILGKNDFNQLCLEYIKSYPSTFFSVNDFGQNVSLFLKNQPKYNNKIWLYELALFEWNLNAIYTSADADYLTKESLFAIPQDCWSMLCFALHPSWRMLSFQTNAVELWECIDKNEQMISVPKEEKSTYALWRFNNDIFYYKIDSGEVIILEGLASGENFGEVCYRLSLVINENQVPNFIVNSLARWVNKGLISSIHLAE